MSLKEIKNGRVHYYVNDGGEYHGEYKVYNKDGHLRVHVYDVNNVKVHNFIKDGDSDLIRTCLYMTYGAPFWGGSDA